MLKHIDLNSDMGERESAEGLALDAELMPFITSVNIACGAHAGSPALMQRTARLAAHYGVAIGAHPSFPDREHFGRIPLSLAPEEIESLVVNQIGILAEMIRQDGLTLTHVKPHGALYNTAAKEHSIAQAIVRAVLKCDSKLLLYALAGSVLVHTARSAGLTVIQEAFADRAYRADGSLVPRSEPGAVLTSQEAVSRQLRQLIAGSADSIDDVTVPIQADSICLHSDTPWSIALAKIIREELMTAGFRIAAFG
ncbi:LamB/YcsF family protein, partial [Petrachloros mirabilis]